MTAAADHPFLAACRGRATTPHARCGSCARPGARCPSTGPSAARARSSTPSPTRSWPPRSRCSRCAATASTPPSSSPTSSCPSPPSASASTSRRAPGPVVEPSRSAPPPTSTASARSTPEARHALRRSRPSRILAEELDVPLIGFAGAPFTVASYLVEGGPSRTYAAHQGADVRRRAAVARAARPPRRPGHAPRCARRSTAGAQAVQLFDSWAGALEPVRLPRATCCPHSAKVLGGRGRPRRAPHPLRRRHRRAARS